MANYKTALMTKAITSGIGDIVGAVTDVQKMGLLRRQMDMESHKFKMDMQKHEADMEKWKQQSRLIPLSEILAGAQEKLSSSGLEITPGMQQFLYKLSSSYRERGEGYEGIRAYNLPEARKELDDADNRIALIKRGMKDWAGELKVMQEAEALQGTEKEGVKKLTPKDLEANQQRKLAISKMQGLAQQELETYESERQAGEYRNKLAEAKQQQEGLDLLAYDYGQKTGDSSGAIAISQAGSMEQGRLLMKDLLPQEKEYTPQIEIWTVGGQYGKKPVEVDMNDKTPQGKVKREQLLKSGYRKQGEYEKPSDKPSKAEKKEEKLETAKNRELAQADQWYSNAVLMYPDDQEKIDAEYSRRLDQIESKYSTGGKQTKKVIRYDAKGNRL